MADLTVHDVEARSPQAQLVDVREDAEVALGRIQGAIHIPLGQLPDRMGELDPQRPVIAICRSGNRSRQAMQALQAAGYACDNMAGGMLAWQAAGLPTI